MQKLLGALCLAVILCGVWNLAILFEDMRWRKEMADWNTPLPYPPGYGTDFGIEGRGIPVVNEFECFGPAGERLPVIVQGNIIHLPAGTCLWDTNQTRGGLNIFGQGMDKTKIIPLPQQ